jgi:2-oxoglutarate dehydrogenase E2 component (dihydrolipoamide succinyltransferase)
MDIKVPEVGESIKEAQVSRWHKAEGDVVAKDELLCELETDKISLELHAEEAGVLSIVAREGETVAIGAVIGRIAESGDGGVATKNGAEEPLPAVAKKGAGKKTAAPPAVATPEPALPAAAPTVPVAPAPAPPAPASAPSLASDNRRSERKPMTPIRRRIAERLVAARQQTAMLTTFNEADLGRIQQLRKGQGEGFAKRHGVKLGLMSFFVKACVEALRAFPEVNARIDAGDIVYQHFYDIGIAVGSERGLVVPVLRDADGLHFAGIERAIADFAERSAANRLTLADLEGGTFTISNGGVYGSLLSTPILNPPQSAVLGLHTIQDRPVVRDGAIVIRPMMYLALSYDHRLIDGRQAVGFLRQVKDYIEAPEELLLEL